MSECKLCREYGVYPYYGVAPHTHPGGYKWPMKTVTSDKSEWPDNFSPDPDVDGCGVYYCETTGCDNGKPKSESGQ